jgi:hypothetical protein
MASVTITQIQLEIATVPNSPAPLNLYWNSSSAAQISIDPTKIIAVGYVWDPTGKVYIPGIIQIYLSGPFNIYSTASYESIVAYMNPTLT